MEEGFEGVLELAVEFLAAEVLLRLLVLLAGLVLRVGFTPEGTFSTLATVDRSAPGELVLEGLVD